MSMCIYFLHTS